MKVHDHRKILRSFYQMKPNSIEVLRVPCLQFISLEGKCKLNGLGLPEDTGWPIFKIVNQLKRISKLRLGYPFKLMPHEYIWHEQHDDGQWSYTQLMQVPDLIDYDMYEEARGLVERNHRNEHVAPTILHRAEQGNSIQKLHKGHHRNISRTHGELQTFASHNGYTISGSPRMILVHWCAHDPDKWESIVRVPIQ
jgi:hypothetical protein